MIRNTAWSLVGLSLIAVPVAAFGATLGFNLNLRVPVYCTVSHQAINIGAPAAGGGVSLGQFSEYCNAPGGYKVILNYTPGTLVGAKIIAGDEQVVLNGAGRAILSQTNGPRIMERTIAATPGEDGFNTDRIGLEIETN